MEILFKIYYCLCETFTNNVKRTMFCFIEKQFIDSSNIENIQNMNINVDTITASHYFYLGMYICILNKCF